MDLAHAGYETDSFTHRGKERTVFRKGTGPAVIVIAELPGITPKVITFADQVADLGCTAVLPHLFGEPGKAPPADTLGMVSSMPGVMVPLCVSREFVVFALGRTSPVVRWLRALAAHEHERCGGPGVGAVGMCFTGGYALAMATDPSVTVPVLSQPSLPVAVSPLASRTIDCSRRDLATVAECCEVEGLEVIGLRFKTDRLVPAERFAFLRDRLGDAFIAVELEGSDANPDGRGPAHSVLTEHLIDEPGEPTHEALQLVLDHLRRKLVEPAAQAPSNSAS